MAPEPEGRRCFVSLEMAAMAHIVPRMDAGIAQTVTAMAKIILAI